MRSFPSLVGIARPSVNWIYRSSVVGRGIASNISCANHPEVIKRNLLHHKNPECREIPHLLTVSSFNADGVRTRVVDAPMHGGMISRLVEHKEEVRESIRGEQECRMPKVPGT